MLNYSNERILVFSPFGSVKESCARNVLRKLNEWIGRRVAEATESTFNVFLADYVDLDEDKFAKTVIKLNLVPVNPTELTEVVTDLE